MFRVLYRIVLLFLFSGSLIFAQTIVFNPAKGYSPGSKTLKPKLFFSPADSLIFSWNQTASSSYKIKIGQTRGTYSKYSISVTGTRKSIIPSSSAHNITTGRYFGIITNSTENSISKIKEDAKTNSGIKYSNEIEFIIEAQTAPVAKVPRGKITEQVPVFEWNPIAGVKAYWLIVSGSPFSVVTFPSGKVSVQGANVMWDYVTKGTTVKYGEQSSLTEFGDDAPPLIPGKEYNYTILNLYDETDLSYVSSVFGGAVSFSNSAVSHLSRPVLVSPADKLIMYSEEEIKFRWDPVNGASHYSVYLFERVKSFAGNDQQIDLPVWSSSVMQNEITFPAKGKLKNSDYIWYVVPFDSKGEGNISNTNSFKYVTETGSYIIRAFRKSDKSALLGFDINIKALEGGSTAANSLVASNTNTYKDSLTVGKYSIKISKKGFTDTTLILTIKKGTTSSSDIYLSSVASIIKGKVTDNSGNTIEDASIKITKSDGTKHYDGFTDNSGEFAIQVPQGLYEVTATKSGYRSDKLGIQTSGSVIEAGRNLILINEPVYLFGRVTNEFNKPVQLVLIKAIKADESVSAVTDGNGNYSIKLTPGVWSVGASKSGYVSALPVNINLLAGQTAPGMNFNLSANSSQITGFVKAKYVTGNTVSMIPEADAEVAAVNSTGKVITVRSGNMGQFTLDLNEGSYILYAKKKGFNCINKQAFSLSAGESVSSVVLEIEAGSANVSGEVINLNGQPVQDAEISDIFGNKIRTSSSGLFTLIVPPGKNKINMYKEGYITPSAIDIEANPGSIITGLQFKAAGNAGRITGKVTNAGNGVSGADIKFENGITEVMISTMETGDFSAGLAAGYWNLTIEKDGFKTKSINMIKITSGQRTTLEDIFLETEYSEIEGNVTGGGNILSGATVKLIGGNLEYGSVTNQNGFFRIRVKPGIKYKIEINKKGFSGYNAWTPILADKQVNRIEAVLLSADASISGNVLDDQGKNTNNAEISVYNSAGTKMASAVSASDGSFNLSLNSGSYKIRAEKPGYKPDEIQLTLSAGMQAENLSLSITEDFAFIYGIVKGSDGKKLNNAKIIIKSSSKTYSDFAASEGSYSISGIIPGNYQIEVKAVGYSVFKKSITFAGSQNIELNAVLQYNNSTISGTVKTEKGNVLAGANVEAVNENKEIYFTETDETGSFSITPLASGSYSLKVSKAGYIMPEEVDTSVINSVLKLEIANIIKVSGSLKGKVTSAGTGIPNALITLNSSKGSFSSSSSLNGDYVFTEIHEGDYQMKIVKSGYRTWSGAVQVTASSIRDAELVKNIVKVAGVIKEKSGKTINFSVPIKLLVSSGLQFSATSDFSGVFEFTAVPDSSVCTIITSLTNPSYANDTLTITIPKGSSNILGVVIELVEKRSIIKGNTQIPNVPVALKLPDGSSIKRISSSTGDFRLENLRAGTYNIKPVLPGYSFQPLSANLTLSGTDSALVNFKAVSNTGSLYITTKDNAGKSVPGVTVSAINTEKYTVSGKTGIDGTLAFPNIPAGTYKITVVKTGFTSVQSSISKEIAKDQTVTAGFSLKPNTSGISGKIYKTATENVIAEALITLNYYGINASFQTKSDLSGSFSLNSIPSGKAKLKILKAGFFADSSDIEVADNQVISGKVNYLNPANVSVRGRITYKGVGVQGYEMKAVSGSEYKVQTNANGYYTFNELPISVNPKDTSVFKISPLNGGTSHTLRVTADKKGTLINIPTRVLPSGYINIKVTDNEKPLAGIKVKVIGTEGFENINLTDEQGYSGTPLLLAKGTYTAEIAATEYLLPLKEFLTFNLASDTAGINAIIPLPFKGELPDTFFTGITNTISLVSNQSSDRISGILYYRAASESIYNHAVLQKNNGKTYFEIPPVYSDQKIVLYFETEDLQSGIRYRSSEYSFQPVAKDYLTSLMLLPDIKGIFLRPGDEYDFELRMKDGGGNIIDAKSKTAKTFVQWEIDEDVAEIEFPVSADSTKIILRPKKEGNPQINIKAGYNGRQIEFEPGIKVSGTPLNKLVLNSPYKSVSNTVSEVPLEYFGMDTLGNVVKIGSAGEFSVKPAGAGIVSQAGRFIPSGREYLGETEILLYDNITSLSASARINIFAVVNSEDNYRELSDGESFNIILRPNCVNARTEIYLEKQKVGNAKKQLISGNVSYTLFGDIFRISYNSSSALPGDSLITPASLELFSSKDIRSGLGNKKVGFFDIKQKRWYVISNTIEAETGFSAGSVSKFGDYGIMTENLPLGFRHAAVLPSPFSPEVAPLKIGYYLTTSDAVALVTIMVYNLEGELVRVILDGDMQFPGIYGSKAGHKEIIWDGLTDSGSMARNGRYIILLKAKDSSGEKKELLKAVLIK